MGASNVSVRCPLKMGGPLVFYWCPHVERVENRFNEWKVNIIILSTFIYGIGSINYIASCHYYII